MMGQHQALHLKMRKINSFGIELGGRCIRWHQAHPCFAPSCRYDTWAPCIMDEASRVFWEGLHARHPARQEG